MGKPQKRRTPTLTISLTEELAEAVSSRVATGFYTSASELIREALRLFLKQERAAANYLPAVAETAERYGSMMELFDLGRGMQIQKLSAETPGLSAEEIQQRLADLAAEQEGDEFLRRAPERLRRLKLDDPGS